MTKSLRRICESLYELEQPALSARILTMEGMRGLAVILVFFVHYHALFGKQLAGNSLTFRLSSFLECIGHSGVDLFFVLSGYLIYSILMKGRVDVSKFITRRVKRIYPTFLAVFAIYLVLSAIFPNENKIPAGVTAAGVYLLQNLLLLPGMFEIRPLITVTWSLSYEFFFYLTLPLVMAVLGLRSWRQSRRVLFFLAVALGLIACSFASFYPRLQVILFIAGMLVYEARTRSTESVRKVPNADVIGLSALVLTFAVVYLLALQPWFVKALPAVANRAWTYREVVLAAGFFVLFLCSLGATSALGRALSWMPLRWLGNMSYSYYLIHGLTLKGIALLVNQFLSTSGKSTLIYWVGMPILFAATWIVSTALFVLVEKRFSLGARPAPSAAASGLAVPAQS